MPEKTEDQGHRVEVTAQGTQAERGYGVSESEEATDVAPVTPEPETPRLRRVRDLYLHTIPQIIGEVRWLIVLVAALEVAGFVVGYRAAGRTTLAHYANNPAGWPSHRVLFDHLFLFIKERWWGHGWLRFFVPNSLRAIYAWLWSLFTLGGYAVWSAWANGWHVGWALCEHVPAARASSGAGPVKAALILLPHGLLEFPAFWIAWALGLRTGLAWLWRAPGCSRRASLKRWTRNSRLALLPILPMLLGAGLLEAYPAEWIRDRYLWGVGVSSQLQSETVLLGDAFGTAYLGHPTVSPSGDECASQSGGKLHVLAFRSRCEQSFPCGRKDSWGSPAWSPDGKRLAVTLSDRGGPNALLIFDRTTEKGSFLPEDEGRVISAWPGRQRETPSR